MKKQIDCEFGKSFGFEEVQGIVLNQSKREKEERAEFDDLANDYLVDVTKYLKDLPANIEISLENENIVELVWKLFKKSGKISYYMLYKALQAV